MNVAYAVFGVWALVIGCWAASRALRAGEIASRWSANYRPAISRQSSPSMFWLGIGFYTLIAAVGATALVASLFN